MFTGNLGTFHVLLLDLAEPQFLQGVSDQDEMASCPSSTA